jgi:hypothetical protein
MGHSTDLKREAASAEPGTFAIDVAEVLVAVADHFTTVNPTEALEQPALLIAFGAEAYKFTHRSTDGGCQALARASLAAAPEPATSITRGEYALVLRRTAVGMGATWGDDANERVIPIIPAPRPHPPQPQPEQSSAPTCCGRAMNHDGQQWVCGKCGAWHDLGGGK